MRIKKTGDSPVVDVVNEWLKSRTRTGKTSRNTVAAGIVVLHKLRSKCPLEVGDLFSEGGELKGARSGLQVLLKVYGIPEKFLKEATARQVGPDARDLMDRLQFGRILVVFSLEDRNAHLLKGIGRLVQEANQWLRKQPIRINCDRHNSPRVWVELILERARGRSGGVVEQHLIGAKLQRRHSQQAVPNYPSHAADTQTGRSGDFSLPSVSYHVTATDGKVAIQRCKKVAGGGTHQVILVPKRHLNKAEFHTEEAGIKDRVTVLSIEDFVAQNIIELSTELGQNFFTILQSIVEEYNRRLEEVETDMSLRIELQ